MPLQPGAPAFGCETAESRPRTDAVSAGDAVALSDGEMDQATDSDEFAGIAGKTDTVILSGVTLANVDTDDADGAVEEGTTLSPSPDAGELYRSYNTDAEDAVTGYNAGPVLALSDEGGSWHGSDGTYNVPDGYAVVYVRGR